MVCFRTVVSESCLGVNCKYGICWDAYGRLATYVSVVLPVDWVSPPGDATVNLVELKKTDPTYRRLAALVKSPRTVVKVGSLCIGSPVGSDPRGGGGGHSAADVWGIHVHCRTYPTFFPVESSSCMVMVASTL